MATNPKPGLASLEQMVMELELGRVLTLPESDLRTFLSKNQFPSERIVYVIKQHEGKTVKSM